MPQPRLDTENARKTLQEFRFADLFIEVLNWNNPSRRTLLTLADEDDAQWQAQEISELGGLRVYEIWPVNPDTALPNAKNQQLIWQGLRAQSVENIAIFVDAQASTKRTQSLWYWMKRDGLRTLPHRHTYIKGQPGDLFLSKLAALVVDLSELNEQGDVSITNAAERVRSALDVETVTKVFFREFKEVHDGFLAQIEGIADENDRRWYASVLLNRLMFIWFLQKKFFLDGGDQDYLRRKYETSSRAEAGNFSPISCATCSSRASPNRRTNAVSWAVCRWATSLTRTINPNLSHVLDQTRGLDHQTHLDVSMSPEHDYTVGGAGD